MKKKKPSVRLSQTKSISNHISEKPGKSEYVNTKCSTVNTLIKQDIESINNTRIPMLGSSSQLSKNNESKKKEERKEAQILSHHGVNSLGQTFLENKMPGILPGTPNSTSLPLHTSSAPLKRAVNNHAMKTPTLISSQESQQELGSKKR